MFSSDADPLWTEGMRHACENITLPQTSFAGGNNLQQYSEKIDAKNFDGTQKYQITNSVHEIACAMSLNLKLDAACMVIASFPFSVKTKPYCN